MKHCYRNFWFMVFHNSVSCYFKVFHCSVSQCFMVFQCVSCCFKVFHCSVSQCFKVFQCVSCCFKVFPCSVSCCFKVFHCSVSCCFKVFQCSVSCCFKVFQCPVSSCFKVFHCLVSTCFITMKQVQWERAYHVSCHHKPSNIIAEGSRDQGSGQRGEGTTIHININCAKRTWSLSTSAYTQSLRRQETESTGDGLLVRLRSLRRSMLQSRNLSIRQSFIQSFINRVLFVFVYIVFILKC